MPKRFTHTYVKFMVKQKIMQILILSFDLVKQILALLTGAKIQSDILGYQNSDI